MKLKDRIKPHSLLQHGTEGVILSERSLRKKNKYQMILLICEMQRD